MSTVDNSPSGSVPEPSIIGEFPCTQTQLRCWILDQLNPGNPAFYDGAAFPAWKDDFLLPSFTKGLLRYDTQGGKPVGDPEYLLGDLKQRLCDVRVGPKGELYILTDETDGALLKVTPGA